MNTLNANDYLGLLAASSALTSMAEDEPETYGKDADYADRALTKVWELLTPAQQAIVREKLGIE